MIITRLESNLLVCALIDIDTGKSEFKEVENRGKIGYKAKSDIRISKIGRNSKIHASIKYKKNC